MFALMACNVSQSSRRLSFAKSDRTHDESTFPRLSPSNSRSATQENLPHALQSLMGGELAGHRTKCFFHQSLSRTADFGRIGVDGVAPILPIAAGGGAAWE